MTAFEQGWTVVKNEGVPTKECAGCGLAHGTPNSDYCSEECQSQNEDWTKNLNPFLFMPDKPTTAQRNAPGVEEVRDLVQQGMEVMPAVQQVARLLGVDGRKLMGAYVKAYR